MRDAPQVGAAGAVHSGRARRADVLAQTARIPFRELQRFFAAGRLVQVADGLDLIDVALCLADDDSERAAAWIAGASLAPVGDALARQWLAADQSLWAVVTDPWVLVQERRPSSPGALGAAATESP